MNHRFFGKPVALVALVAIALGSQACGAGPGPSAATPTPAPTATAAADKPSAMPTSSGPSPQIRRRWAMGTGGDFFLYANVETLMATAFARTFVPTLLEWEGLSPDQARCGEKLAASAKELLMGTGGDGLIALLRIDESRSPLALCAKALSAAPDTLPGATGAPEAWSMGGTWIAHEPGLLLIGSPGAIRSALLVQGTPNAPGSLDLKPGEHLAVSAVVGPSVPLHGTLAVSAARFGFELEATPPGQGHAEKLVAAFDKFVSQPTFPGLDAHQNQMARRLLNSVTVTQKDGRISALLEVRGGAVDQASRFGEVTSLAIYTVRQYLQQSKAAEARWAVEAIARDYVSFWEREEVKAVPRAKKKLMSFPPVPSAVPRGRKYASQAAEWKAWAPLHFEMSDPQYFQYEIKAAQDGESADIIARGDLNGDGKASLYVVHVKVDRKKQSTLVIAPQVDITDPLE